MIKFPGFIFGGVQFGPAYIPSYLLTATTAVIVIVLLAFREANRKKVDKRQIWHLILYSIVSGFFFARLFYLLFYYSAGFTEKALFFFNFSKSGLSSFGGIFGIIIGVMLYRHFNKTNIWKLADVGIIGLMLGLAIARVGCYLAGCCYGKSIVWNIPWAVQYKGALRHPTQAYDILNGLLVYGTVNRLKYMKLFDGAIFLSTFIIYSFIRFMIEFFRANQRLLGLTYNQYFYGMLFIACSLIYWRKASST